MKEKLRARFKALLERFSAKEDEEKCGHGRCCGDDCCSEDCCGTKNSEFDKITLIRIAAAAVLFIAGIIIKAPAAIEFIIFFAAFVIVGYDVVIEGIECLVRRKTFNENILMTVASIGAFAIGEFAEAAAVMLLFQIGELLQAKAVAGTRSSVRELLDMRPEKVTVIDKATLVEYAAEDVKPGMMTVIKPGERFALDCIITEGTSTVDTSALTGESLPRTVTNGDEVLAGTVNIGSIVYARVENALADSAVSRILDMVENAEKSKAKPEKLMSRFAKIYTPVVIVLALLIAFLMPLITGQSLGTWIHRGLVFLIVSCPCAIVISLPLTYFSGIGGAARNGVLYKSAAALDMMADAGTVVFDKTGTLTSGSFRVSKISANGIDNESLLMLAAYTEAFSNHPLARAIRSAYGRKIDHSRVKQAKEEHGRGVSAILSGTQMYAGNALYMESLGIVPEGGDRGETTVYIAIGNQLAGYIVLEDTVKDDAETALRALRENGMERLAMLSGDREKVAAEVGEKLGVTEVHAECLPGDKMGILQEIIAQTKQGGKYTVFVGDGINDAPALKAADIGVAMGGIGADSAIEAADVVIMDDRLSPMLTAVSAAKTTRKLVKQNIIVSLAIKLIVMILGILGIATMWFAVFADVGVAIVCIINATRALSIENVDSNEKY